VIQTANELSVVDYCRAVGRDWRLLAAVTLSAAILSIAFALLVTEKYEGVAVVVDAEGGRTSGVTAAMLGQLGGLAGLAGIDVSQFAGTTNNARAVLNSRTLVEEFITHNGLLPILFSDDWDATRKRWKSSPDEAPTLWLGVRKFVEHVRTIEEDPVTGIVRIKVEWDDPKIAADWANGLVALANQIVRSRDLRDAQKSVAYLQGEIGKTHIVGLQQVLYSLVESEMQTIMLANVTEEYAFKVIDPAVVPELRSFPHRTLIVLVGTVLGGFLALMVILVRLVLSREREAPESSV
jgi:uncharacterized protein involved in exopolysaccharide biosynthesis